MIISKIHTETAALAFRIGSSAPLRAKRIGAMESFEELLDASWCSFRRKLLEAPAAMVPQKMDDDWGNSYDLL